VLDVVQIDFGGRNVVAGRQLRPNDLDGLICWFKDGNVCFDHLAHLSGLRSLEITDAKIEEHIDLHGLHRRMCRAAIHTRRNRGDTLDGSRLTTG
jgi:hypothetical protein